MTIADLRKWLKARTAEVRPQIHAAFKSAGLIEQYSALSTSAMLEAMIIGYGSKLPEGALMEPAALLSRKLNATVPLSKRIWTSGKNTENEVMSLLSNGLRSKSAWMKTAMVISDKELSSGSITATIDNLVIAAKRTGIDAASLAEYKRALRIAQRHVEGLAASGATTEYLKNSYQAVIDATLTKSAAVIERKLAIAVQDKIRYEAERLVRTETARAYGISVYNAALTDNDVVGVRSTLSSSHPLDDICDFYAEADLFGMGEGVFPKNEAPPYPYHPNCLCSLSPVYQSEIEGASMNDGAAEKWITEQDADTRQSLLGVEGAKAFEENKETWKDNLRGWNGLENKRVIAI
jgi:hypothetical protein